MGGHKTMAYLSGKGHGKKDSECFEYVVLKRKERIIVLIK